MMELGDAILNFTSSQHGPQMAQRRPDMGPTWLNMGPTWPNISPRWLNMGPTWPNMGTTCVQHRPRLLHTGKHCALSLPQFNIALLGFARRISAQSSHTMRQTSLLAGARLSGVSLNNPGAGHGARVLAGGLRW